MEDIILPTKLDLSSERMNMNMTYEVESSLFPEFPIGVGTLQATYTLNPDVVLSEEDAKEFKKQVSNLLMNYIEKTKR